MSKNNTILNNSIELKQKCAENDLALNASDLKMPQIIVVQ